MTSFVAVTGAMYVRTNLEQCDTVQQTVSGDSGNRAGTGARVDSRPVWDRK